MFYLSFRRYGKAMFVTQRSTRMAKTSEVEPLDYQRDSIELYKYHLPSIYKRIAVHMHALNKKIAKDPRALVNILPVGSGLTIVTKL